MTGSGAGSITDDQHLARLGKRPVLKRSFGFMSMLGFSCTVLITWEGILMTSVQGLMNGGPAGVIWGYLVVWLGTLSTFATIAELASMAPTAAGQYHWVAMLAPSSCRNFLSYITAWVTFSGWQAVAASAAYLIATIIQGIAALTHPEYALKAWHGLLICWTLVAFSVLINSTGGRILARFEGLVLILHLVGFFAVLIPLVYFGHHSSPSFVFTTFLNGGDWSTQTLSFFVGLPASVFALIGADSAVHMSEEIQSAATIVPQALIYSLLINGILGWAMVIAMIFCMGDPNEALNAQATVIHPFLHIFHQAVKSTTGAALMASIVVVLGAASTVGCYASASRMLWSFSRDKGPPLSGIVVKLAPSTSIPIYAVFVTLIISMLLSLITLGSSVAFTQIGSLSTAGLYASYLLVCSLLLWRRVTGSIKPASNETSVVGPDNLYWGPWRLSEPLGTLSNGFACVYLLLLWFWCFWPPASSVRPETMNFSSLVFGSVVLFSILWYVVRARHTFRGPLREVNPSDIPY
ncbi:amino acid transporter [Zopfia rhizophila CBS 207.26]|uniref:Amino acid transporter n=1 Tax=Zopfia rhizophila CBS 207.26 TaxID=1314779 RepID=A0A6A6DJD2_9PEZI|nr:amino acid transporter [Zopfia rhizophila CBS 207.26]